MSMPGHQGGTDPAGATRLGMSGGDTAFLAVLGAGLGAGAAAVLPVVARWTEQRGVPFPGPLQLLASFDSDWLVWGRPVIGLVVGVVAALLIAHHQPVLHITRDSVLVEKGSDRRRIRREDVAGVFREGSKLVIETEQGRRLYEGDVDGGREKVRDAFRGHGYPWENED
ncbi:hypothetical protein MWU75_07620 [Ornithinimicrobium sp. F0845]|uniref:YqeB family protein n=1 Tax=Ornithinimicrobium sp. F0845 TaxID=2926412 RepID=UPI001FF6B464|nr:hypothetical protein [Ornithinimicrobium sp. F0845]MCK0112001.1 hypothetical protein [Ornithinimicrobium sp. F0845]